jgi:8-oxo-dGTP pyrophosphatase MutT (NUDIX family)
MFRKKERYRSYCIAFIQGNDSILLIEKPDTYQAACLINGRKYYKLGSTPESLMNYANKMTLAEKKRFISPSFDFVKEHLNSYSKYKKNASSDEWQTFVSKAQSEFNEDFNILRPYIVKSLNRSINGGKPYSFPGGRRSSRDLSDIFTAQRETEEETRIKPNMYSMLDIPPYRIPEYTDDGNIYGNTLYFAKPNGDFKYFIDKNDADQSVEVRSINWFKPDEFAKVHMCDITRKHILGNMKNMLTYFFSNRKHIISLQDYLGLSSDVSSSDLSSTHHKSETTEEQHIVSNIINKLIDYAVGDLTKLRVSPKYTKSHTKLPITIHKNIYDMLQSNSESNTPICTN